MREHIDKDLGAPIAYGRTSEIYAWQESQVVKLFHNWFALKYIEYEAQMAQAAYASGLPVPAVGELIRVNDRHGLVYERVTGISMKEMLLREPENSRHYAHRMAELQADMHASPVEAEFPPQRQMLIRKIHRAEVLPAHLQTKALSALETMPDGEQICHGDFHPGNILITSQGEVIVDWIDASNGNPLADLARSSILALGGTGASQSQELKTLIHTLHTEYIRHYFELRPGGEEEYRRWLPIVAAARLSEGISELEKWLIAQVEQGL